MNKFIALLSMVLMIALNMKAQEPVPQVEYEPYQELLVTYRSRDQGIKTCTFETSTTSIQLFGVLTGYPASTAYVDYTATCNGGSEITGTLTVRRGSTSSSAITLTANKPANNNGKYKWSFTFKMDDPDVDKLEIYGVRP